MTKAAHVLILGDPDDQTVYELYQRCQQAGMQVYFYGDRECEAVEPNAGPFDVVVLGHRVMPDIYFDHLPESVHKNIDENTLLLVNSLASLPSEALANLPVKPKKAAGFSLFAWIQNRDVVELCELPADKPDAARLHAADFFGVLNQKTLWVPETPGLVLGRIVAMLVNEAASALMEGVASAGDIDNAMTYGTNYPDGPLSWGDKAGADTILDILTGCHQTYGEARYRPVLLVRQKAASGGAFHPENTPSPAALP